MLRSLAAAIVSLLPLPIDGWRFMRNMHRALTAGTFSPTNMIGVLSVSKIILLLFLLLVLLYFEMHTSIDRKKNKTNIPNYPRRLYLKARLPHTPPPANAQVYLQILNLSFVVQSHPPHEIIPISDKGEYIVIILLLPHPFCH